MAALSLCAVAWLPSAAQRVRGVVRDAQSSAAIAGAVVSALDSLRQPVARTLTDAAGRYAMELPASAAIMRVIRIGFQPRVVALAQQHEEPRVVDVELSKLVTLLSTVDVKDARLCSSDVDRAGALSLWEQARAGLLASVVARDASPATASTVTYDRAILADSGRVVNQTSRVLNGATTRPFAASASPATLAKRGYWSGPVAEERFSGPDADVLLDDSFPATHCFRIAQADTMHSGAIGLAFQPTRGRDSVVDVKGTLWIESDVPALRVLEFTYTDAAGKLAEAGAGGSVHFRTAQNGVSFIDTWTLNFPVIDNTRSAVEVRNGRVEFTGQRRVPFARSETGGIVLRAEWSDGARYDADMQPLTGVVTDAETSAGFVGAMVVLEGTRDTVETDANGRFSIFPVLPGRYEVTAADTSASEYVGARVSRQPLEIVKRPPTVRLALTGRMAAIRSLCTGFDYPPTASLLLGHIIDASAIKKADPVEVVAAWFHDSSATEQETQTIHADAAGHFSVCGVPRNQTLLLSATAKGADTTDTELVIDSATLVAAMDWPVAFKAVAPSAKPRGAVLRGRVADATGDRAVQGAEVWLPALNRRTTTDADGRFELPGMPAGQQLVQVRSIGYRAERSIIAVAAGRETTRDYRLVPAGTTLDTVRTTAVGGLRISPQLKEFDQRRATSGTGYFVADSVFRKHETQTLGSVIVSHTAGVMMSPGRLGSSFLTSTRRACGANAGDCKAFNCYVTIFMDGILFYSVARDGVSNPPDLSRFDVSDVAGVEFYPGRSATPARYQGNDQAGCGTLLIWTREH